MIIDWKVCLSKITDLSNLILNYHNSVHNKHKDLKFHTSKYLHASTNYLLVTINNNNPFTPNWTGIAKPSLGVWDRFYVFLNNWTMCANGRNYSFFLLEFCSFRLMAYWDLLLRLAFPPLWVLYLIDMLTFQADKVVVRELPYGKKGKSKFPSLRYSCK